MKVLRLLVSSLIFTLVFTALAFAQTEQTQSVAPNKVGFINSDLFYDEDTRIKELAIISKQVNLEFKSKIVELISLSNQIGSLSDELIKLRPQIEDYKVGDCPFYESKLEQYEKLGTEYKQKLDEFNHSYYNRKIEAEGFTKTKITVAIRQFSREKGFTAIVDFAKIGSEFTWISNETIDVTDEFINYYNSLPAEQR